MDIENTPWSDGASRTDVVTEHTALLPNRSCAEDLSDSGSCFSESEYECDSDSRIAHSHLEASVMLPSRNLQSFRWALKTIELSRSPSSKQLGVQESLVEKEGADKNSSIFMTISNLLPLLQGSAVFGMPFAVSRAGLLVIPSFIMLCAVADMTGLLLLECLYEISPRSGRRKRVRMDYYEIAKACWGLAGKRIVTFLNIVYMLINDIVHVVLLGSSAHQLISVHFKLSIPATMAVLSLVFIPTLFIRRLSILSYFSMVGVFSIIIGSLAAFVVLIEQHTVWAHTLHTLPLFSAENYALGIAIMMYSVIVHPLLPQIEGCMIEPKRIDTALHLSYGISTVFKILFGFFGAMTFGLATEQLVAMNIAKFSFAANVVIMGSLCLYPVTNFGLLMFLVCEMLDQVCVESRFPSLAKGGKWNILWMAVSRTVLVGFCVGVACSLPYFALVSGVCGALIALCLVYGFPIMFHLQLKWRVLTLKRKMFEILILILGVVVGFLALCSSMRALILTIMKSDK